MKVLIIADNELKRFPMLNSAKDSYWQPENNTISGVYYLLPNAEKDIKKARIPYSIDNIEIKTELDDEQ